LLEIKIYFFFPNYFSVAKENKEHVGHSWGNDRTALVGAMSELA